MQAPGLLAQMELRGEHLVVRARTDDGLDFCPGRPHQPSDLVYELCDGRTRKLVGGRYELRDTPLTLLGVEVFIVWRLIALLRYHPLVLRDVQEHGYALSVLVHYVTPVHSLIPSGSL